MKTSWKVVREVCDLVKALWCSADTSHCIKPYLFLPPAPFCLNGLPMSISACTPYVSIIFPNYIQGLCSSIGHFLPTPPPSFLLDQFSPSYLPPAQKTLTDMSQKWLFLVKNPIGRSISLLKGQKSPAAREMTYF